MVKINVIVLDVYQGVAKSNNKPFTVVTFRSTEKNGRDMKVFANEKMDIGPGDRGNTMELEFDIVPGVNQVPTLILTGIEGRAVM